MWLCSLYCELLYILFKYWWHVWSSFKCASEAINNKCALTLWSSSDVKPQNWPKRGMKTLSAATNQTRMTLVLEFLFISIHYNPGRSSLGRSNFFYYCRKLNGKTDPFKNTFAICKLKRFCHFGTLQQCFSFSFDRK